MRCLDDLSPLGAFVSARFVKERAIGPLEVWRVRPPAVAGAGTAVVALNANEQGPATSQCGAALGAIEPLAFSAPRRALCTRHTNVVMRHLRTTQCRRDRRPGMVG